MDPLSPSQQVAERIVDRLVLEKIITPERAEQLKHALSAGKVKSADWKIVVDLSQKKAEVMA